MAERADGEVRITEHLLELEAVHRPERPLQERRGYLKSNQLLIRVGREGAAPDFGDVERELDHHVTCRRLCIQYGGTVLRGELRIHQRDDAVDGDRMTGIVAGIVREGSQCKGVLIDVASIGRERLDESAGADVVHQV